MNRRRFLKSSLFGLGFAEPSFLSSKFALAASGGVHDAASELRRLFLDASVVEEQAGLKRVFHPLERHANNPVLVADQPWESGKAVSGPYLYGTVLHDGKRLRMWYQLLNEGNHIGYAESIDGLHWEKPVLRIINFKGSTQNNLVVSAADREATAGECHNPSVIHCPRQSDPNRRFALFGFDGKAGQPRVAFSADGLRWRFHNDEGKGLFNSSDVVNFFWDSLNERFAATWKTKNRRGRAAGVAWSKDGIQWTKPIDGPVFGADDLDPDATQIYGMPVFHYEGLYIGLPWIYHARYFKDGPYSVEKMHDAQKDSPRNIDVQLAWSWDLVNWNRTPERAPFLSCGVPGAFDSGMVFTARAPVEVDGRLHFYYGGCDQVHDEKRTRAAIGLATLRKDGFCSMDAGAEEGWLITRREKLTKLEIMINARTASTGEVTAELLDLKNRVIAGFSRKECVSFRGDSTRHSLTWSMASLQDATRLAECKIRFWLRDASLYRYSPAV